MGPSPPAAPSALHCLTHLGDFSTRVGSDGRTKPWVGRTLAGPLGAGGVLWFHPRGHVSRVSEEPLRGRDKNGLWSGRGVQVTCSVEAGGLGGAGGGDRAELVPLGGPSWSSSALGKTGGAFTQLSWWLPAPRGRLKEGPTLLRAALGRCGTRWGFGGGAWRPRRGRGGAGGGAWRPRRGQGGGGGALRGRGEGAAWMTHVRAGERRGQVSGGGGQACLP